MTQLSPSFLCSTPLFARVSGLPGTTVNSFSSNLFCDWIATKPSLEQELAATRAELVERLFQLVRLSSPGLRRFLLTVKRDAFNGRSLVRWRADSQWSELSRLAGPLADRITALEVRLEGWQEGYTAAYWHQRSLEHRELLATLKDSGFRRGLALASPVLAETAERARRAESDLSLTRRESRLDLGLLRYVSRAALKLSPFSTLTRVALGMIDASAPTPLAWARGGWRERSLLRVQRYLIEQDWELLCRYRPVREGLELILNPTLEETSPERYRFLRPERWVPDAQAGKLRHEAASLAEMSLPHLLVAGVFSALEQAPRVYRELVADLAAELGGSGAAGTAAATLDALIEAGVLILVTPWPSNEPHFEKRLLAYLRTLPPNVEMEAVIEALAHLVTLEEGFSEATEPARSIAEMDHALNTLWHSTAPLAGIEPGIGRTRNKPGDVCEDVLLLPAEDGEKVVLRVSQTTVREIVRSAEPWARLTAFLGHRLDFLHTLAAFLGRHWPGRREVGFLEFFGAAQPLWREYRKLLLSGGESWQTTFNPLGLEKVAALARLRTEIWTDLRQSVQALPAGEPIPLAVLEELAARIPEIHLPPVGPCLFVQPAEATGRLWVLNRIFEGTGRYGSRFTTVMDEESRRWYTGRYIRAARLEVEGEPADLLDLIWSRRDILNVHSVQTARVLSIPGETLDPRAAEPVELRDLRVSLHEPSGLPRLTDAGGRRLLPVHLSGTACNLMPFLIQFLAQWGPGEVRPLRSPMPARRKGAVHVMERLTTGCLVLARRRWVVSLGEALRRETASSDEAAFAALNQWRMEHNLPERLFWIEKTHFRQMGDVYKPQYLDFTSPLFVEVFRSALRINSDPLTFEEALPGSRDLPQGPDGQWAVELHLDTLPFGPDDLPRELAGASAAFDSTTSLAAGGRFTQP